MVVPRSMPMAYRLVSDTRRSPTRAISTSAAATTLSRTGSTTPGRDLTALGSPAMVGQGATIRRLSSNIAHQAVAQRVESLRYVDRRSLGGGFQRLQSQHPVKGRGAPLVDIANRRADLRHRCNRRSVPAGSRSAVPPAAGQRSASAPRSGRAPRPGVRSLHPPRVNSVATRWANAASIQARKRARRPTMKRFIRKFLSGCENRSSSGSTPTAQGSVILPLPSNYA